MTEIVSAALMFIAVACSMFQFVLASKLQKIEEKINALEGNKNA